MKKIIFVLVNLFLMYQIQAFDVTVTGGLDQGTQNTNALLSPASQSNGIGGGVLGSFLLGNLGNTPYFLDFGVLYLPRPVLYSIIGTAGTLDYVFPNLMVPVTFRSKLFGFLLARLGLYYSFGIGNATYVSTISGVPSGSKSFEALSTSRTDYGVIAGFGADIQITSWMAFVAEIDAILGLSDIDLTAVRTSYMDVLAFGALRFSFGGRKPS